MDKNNIKQIFNISMIFFNIIAGASSIISIIDDRTNSTYFSIVLIFTCLISCILIVSSIISKFLKPNTEKAIAIMDNFHHLLHEFKDEYVSLLERLEETDSDVEFSHQLLVTTQNFCCSYQKLINEALSLPVNVSIKLFEYNSNKEEIFTYCRDKHSVNQSIKQDHPKKIKISMCTSFSNIMQGRSKFFAESQLKKKSQNNQYFQANSNFKYESAAVFPIRALIKNQIEDNIEVETIGFLCIDTKKNIDFDSFVGQMIIESGRGFADLLYVFMYQMQAYNDNILKEQSIEMVG